MEDKYTKEELIEYNRLKVIKITEIVFDISKDGCYLLDTLELTDAYIGKVFVEEKRSIEKQFIESNLDEADT